MIPDFDHNYVIPPHIGSPVNRAELSPYPCTSLDLCQRFSTSKERIEILKGFLAFRNKMNDIGIIDGFQWLDGSFTEEIEKTEKRPPGDLDCVTFYKGLTPNIVSTIIKNFNEFRSSTESKKIYKLDHYSVDYGYSPEVTVETVRYWLQLFSHNRNNVWKGILKIDLNTPHIDKQAVDFLKGL